MKDCSVISALKMATVEQVKNLLKEELAFFLFQISSFLVPHLSLISKHHYVIWRPTRKWMANLASILNHYLKIIQNKLNKILLYKNVIITIFVINHEENKGCCCVLGIISSTPCSVLQTMTLFQTTMCNFPILFFRPGPGCSKSG